MSSPKPTVTRWYIVLDKKDGAACLVEANNRAQAFRRAAEYYCTARPATVDEALKLAQQGRDVIYAPDAPEQLDLEEMTKDQAQAKVEAMFVDPTPPDQDELRRLGNVINEPEPELPEASPALREAGKVMRQTTRRAADVFGAGFGSKSAADSVD